MANYSDEQRVDIAKNEYNDYKEGEPVYIDDRNIKIGYVSEVVNNEKTGEQAYIITDGDPRVQNPSEVNNVTVLYQGSTSPDKIGSQAGEVKRDWWDNNKKIASNVLKGYNNPKAEFEPTGQMKSSGKTLNNAMGKYKNARFDVYGHSQASSNAQYALGSLDSQDKLDRINGAFLYQGPNAYVMMSKEQRERVKQLKDRIFNFVDEKDLVPIGYRIADGIVNPFHVGTLIFVDSKKKGMMDQHMWGGYQFVSGDLQVTKESIQQYQAIKHAYNMSIMSTQMKNLDQLEKN